MYQIKLAPEAMDDLKRLRKYDQQEIVDGIKIQLSYEPARETHKRKRLRPNQLAEWELRVGAFRVFYDVDDLNNLVRVVAIGYKTRHQLFVHGEEYEL